MYFCYSLPSIVFERIVREDGCLHAVWSEDQARTDQKYVIGDDMPEVEDFETRWPKEGDRLFAESVWGYGAPVVRDPGERFYSMPLGYKRGGDILINQAAVDVLDRPNVIYAALFCYRQFVELSLKHLIGEFGKGETPKEKHQRIPINSPASGKDSCS